MILTSQLIGDRARAFALPYLKRAAGGVTRWLPISQPILLVGPGASARLGQTLNDLGHRKVLIVTDEVVSALGLLTPLTDALTQGGTAFTVFDEVTADAPIPMLERGIQRFEAEQCDAIVAIGGGSVMDAAKAIGLSAANNKHPSKLVGYFKGRHGPAPIYAVPTTAGTGSEVTVAAVVSDPTAHLKRVIADTRLVPRMAALDPCLMTGLPAAVTAATGMDALTHAVEAYISQWCTEFTDQMALAAVGMIYRNLPLAFANGQDLVAREKMALASTYAGLAFTRANVGNVHAIAHQLGGWYHTPHGLANAILLPSVLRFTGTAITSRLAELAVRSGLGQAGESKARLAQKFLDSLDAMNRLLGIPRQLDALRAADIPALATAACHEANTGYPVPKIMTQQDCETLLRGLLPKRTRRAQVSPKAAPKVASKVAPELVAPKAARKTRSAKAP